MFYVFCDKFDTYGQKLYKIFILFVLKYVSNYLNQFWFLFGSGYVIYTHTFYLARRRKKKNKNC